MTMEETLSVNIVVREEKLGKKKVFIINNEELGIADFGDTFDKAIDNFKKSMRLYLEVYPDKKIVLYRSNSIKDIEYICAGKLFWNGHHGHC